VFSLWMGLGWWLLVCFLYDLTEELGELNTLGISLGLEAFLNLVGEAESDELTFDLGFGGGGLHGCNTRESFW